MTEKPKLSLDMDFEGSQEGNDVRRKGIRCDA
jgi:hypothetical protein